MKALLASMLTAALAVGTACSGSRTAPVAAPPMTSTAPGRTIGGTPADIPRAVVYRTNGDYADNVPVTVAADGTLLSYPAPGDVGAHSAPVRLADGLLLDRRGIGRGTVFTTYTYSDYSRLPEAPSAARLKAAIIAGSGISFRATLPMTLAEALADTAAVNDYIRSHPQEFAIPHNEHNK